MEEIYRSQFRMPHSLYENLKAAADKNRRSVNAELVARLEESFAYEPESHFKGIDKAALMATVGDTGLYSAQDFMEAVMSALGVTPPDNARPKSNTGPKPRKRYPKD